MYIIIIPISRMRKLSPRKKNVTCQFLNTQVSKQVVPKLDSIILLYLIYIWFSPQIMFLIQIDFFLQYKH